MAPHFILLIQIMKQDYSQPSYNKLLNKQTEREKPYTAMKYEENYIAATEKVIDFFSMNNIKKYIDFENKAIFNRELMEQILKQLREFLRKKATVMILLFRDNSKI